MKDVDIQGILLRKITVGSFDNNVYFLVDPGANESIIIDAPAEPDRILQAVTATQVKLILLTHGHMDHVMALEKIRNATQAPLAVHPGDEKAFGVRADIRIEDDHTFEIGRNRARVLHTPGHTPGSICLLIDRHLISGDTLFPGGPGKTGSPEAFEQIIESITQEIYSLPDDTVVYPGHGPNTTVGESKAEYRVFSEKKRTRPVYGDVEWLKS